MNLVRYIFNPRFNMAYALAAMADAVAVLIAYILGGSTGLLFRIFLVWVFSFFVGTALSLLGWLRYRHLRSKGKILRN